MSEKVKVEIYMDGGIIHDITGPNGTPLQLAEVTVFDYDLEGLEEDEIETDREGDRVHIQRWYHDGEPT